jgi:hypothetical protein
MTVITNKRGIDAWMATIIAIVMIVIFALLVIPFFASGEKSVTQSISARILSKVNIEALPIQLSNLIPESIKEKSFKANITMIPNQPFCQDEKIKLSALYSKLPVNVTIADLNCTWDLNADNVIDGNECEFYTRNATSRLNLTNIKLTVKIAKGEISLGETRDATATISGTTPFCICDDTDPLRHCLLSTGLTGKIVINGDKINITLPTREGPSMYNVRVTDIHIETYIDQQVKSLRIVGESSSFYDVSNISAGSYVIDGNEKTSSAYTLVDGINNALQKCRDLDENMCTITLQWQIVPAIGFVLPHITIGDVNIPYELKLF